MKVLVLTVTSGEGHNAQGRALINELNARNHEGKMHDYFKTTSKIRTKLSNDVYFYTLKHFPKFSKSSYKKVINRDITKPIPKTGIFPFMLNSKNSQKEVIKIIDEYKPDFIFCSHVYTAVFMSQLKEQGKYLDIPVFYAVSDYVTHGYTEHARNINYLITPNHDLDDILFKMGYKEEQLLPFGIIVDSKFSKHLDKIETRKKLNFDLNKPIIYIANGATGFGDNLNLIKTIDELDEDFEMVIINGRNEKMFNKVNSLQTKHKIHNFGFVNNIEEFLSSCDIMIGKIGGIGLMEAFNKNLPIICIGEPPFQEVDNLYYLEPKKALIHTNSILETKEKIKELINNPSLLDEVKENIKQLAKPNCTKDFVDFLEKLYNK